MKDLVYKIASKNQEFREFLIKIAVSEKAEKVISKIEKKYKVTCSPSERKWVNNSLKRESEAEIIRKYKKIFIDSGNHEIWVSNSGYGGMWVG